MRHARLVVVLGLVGLVGGLSGGVVVPQRFESLRDTGAHLLAVAVGEIPTPVVVVAALVSAVVLWVVAIRYVLAASYRLWRRISNRVYWLLTLVLPESPVVKFASGAMVLIALVIAIVGGLPVLVGDLAESNAGAAGYVNQMNGQLLNAQWDDIVDGDAVEDEPGCHGSVVPVDPGAADRDGDGLPDAWERAGETPTGGSLPGADPGRKDLYVQLNYGSDVEQLSDGERQQLRDSWAAMPVANPDGTTGVTLHLEADADGAGDLGESARITALEDRNAWYTDAHLGPRKCIYRQVVYGKVDADGAAGVASSPGYSAVVDGARQPAYDGSVSFRVALTNHELLHTAVGWIDGDPHTTEGWLAGGSSDEFLSSAAAAELNATGIHGPAG